MPRRGVPSTTDSARVTTDVYGEPAPLPRSTSPRHLCRPSGTFPRVFNPSLRPRKRDERKAHGGLRTGETPAFTGAARWRRFHVPSPFSRRASSIFSLAKTDAPGRTRQAIDFSWLRVRMPRKPARAGAGAHPFLKINRVGANRRELARR